MVLPKGSDRRSTGRPVPPDQDIPGEVWEEVRAIGLRLLAAQAAAHPVMVPAHRLSERRGLIPAVGNGRKRVTADDMERHPEAQSEEELK